MKTLLMVIALVALIGTACRVVRCRINRKSERRITRWNLFRATGIAYTVLASLLIACGLIELIALGGQYGRIGNTAALISDMLILTTIAFITALKICICVKPIWQGVRTGDFDALRNQTLYFNGGFWHYHDSEWYISVGAGQAIVLCRKALDLKHSARIRRESLGKSHSYECCYLPLKNGKYYRAIIGADGYFQQWLKIYGVKIE